MGKLVKIFAGLLIVALDIVAGILGYKAEAAQNQDHICSRIEYTGDWDKGKPQVKNIMWLFTS
ncbi:hypothetical protein KY285_024071 [Solanum tuberosum]|uniref:Uncharacterized protein n=1 Tax=Solanum tuberosum TaxID=4113 RepID=M1B3H3_SOLTU|nr:hypothetical protein KY289_025804 [Solanum tuberosum]KAH0676270.1 hypothetical protein KY285_024071 [Solanum tuberosum]